MDHDHRHRPHLHRDDCPAALAILHAILHRRPDLIEDYEPTENGAFVDWAALGGDGRLSSSERATVHLAHGVAGIERAGGPPPAARAAIAAALASISSQ